MTVELFVIFFCFPLMSIESVVISPVLFLILVICVILSFFLFVRLLKLCQFYWSLQRTNSKTLCFIGFLFLISLFFLLYLLFPSFCLLFIGYWIENLDYWFETYLLFLSAFIAGIFPFSTALSVSYKFWYIVFLFSFSSMHVLVSWRLLLYPWIV